MYSSRMPLKLESDITWELRKDLTDGICASGANIAHMKHVLKQKYVSKKDMRKALENQMKYLDKIQTAKDKVLQFINESKL